MSLPYSDPAFPYGSKVLTINTVTYVANNIRATQQAKEIRRTNELGAPSGNIGVEDFTEGTATLQLATSSTAYPALGDTFAVDLFKAGSTQTYWIKSVSPAYDHEGETLIDISFVKDVAA